MQQTVSIDEIAFLPASGAMPEYVVGPGFQARMMQIAEGARRQGKQLVGFFRSDLRVQKPQPSEKDRLFISLQFRQPVALLLLVQSHTPFTAVFYACSHGEVPAEPSVREFELDESEFRALPEIYREQVQAEQEVEPRPGNRQMYVGLSIAAVLLIIFLGLVTGTFTSRRRLPGDDIGLNVATLGHIVAVTWDHSAHAITSAQSATLVISDAGATREIKLGGDDLHLGSVDYAPTTSQVQVTMSLEEPGSRVVRQSARWNGPGSLP